MGGEVVDLRLQRAHAILQAGDLGRRSQRCDVAAELGDVGRLRCEFGLEFSHAGLQAVDVGAGRSERQLEECGGVHGVGRIRPGGLDLEQQHVEHAVDDDRELVPGHGIAAAKGAVGKSRDDPEAGHPIDRIERRIVEALRHRNRQRRHRHRRGEHQSGTRRPHPPAGRTPPRRPGTSARRGWVAVRFTHDVDLVATGCGTARRSWYSRSRDGVRAIAQTPRRPRPGAARMEFWRSSTGVRGGRAASERGGGQASWRLT